MTKEITNTKKNIDQSDFDLVMETFDYDGCVNCGGSGEVAVPKTYMTCPCCKGRDKFRKCTKCNGKGVTVNE